MAAYYVDHAKGVYPAAASGNPWKAEYIGVKGDPIANKRIIVSYLKAIKQKFVDISIYA